VAVHGPPSDEVRKAVTEGFQRKYGITVEYLGLPGSEFLPRIEAERAGGRYLWDLFLGGTSTVFLNLGPMGAVDPIDPALILPEVKDPKSWKQGALPYFESKRFGLTFLETAGTYFYVNTRQVNPADFRSWRDLLNPRWRGQIVLGRDPRTIGYNQAMFQFFYRHRDLGPGFVRELLRHDLQVLRRDDVLSAQWLAHGRYPLCFCSNIEGDNMANEGLPVKQMDPRQLREGTGVTSAYGNVALFNRAPRPNAAKVFLNWLLSQEGQTQISEGTLLASTRVDIPTQHLDPTKIPQPGWVSTYTEDVLLELDQMLAVVDEVLGKQ
jgi:iron(III) transport system substrate-binding protein